MGVKSIIDVKCDDKNDRPALGAGSDDDDRTCRERTRNHRANRVKWKESRECKKAATKKKKKWGMIDRHGTARRFKLFITIEKLLATSTATYDCMMHTHRSLQSFILTYFFLLLFQLLHSPTNVLCGFTVVQREEFRMKIATATCSNLPSKTFSSFSHRAPTRHDYSHTTYKNISNSSSRK